jgi:hypothetical protein
MTRPGRNEIRLRHARHCLEVCDEALRLLSSGGDLSEIIKDVPNVLEAQNAATELAELMPEANTSRAAFEADIEKGRLAPTPFG